MKSIAFVLSTFVLVVLNLFSAEYKEKNVVSTHGPVRFLSWNPTGTHFAVCCKGLRCARIMSSTGEDRKNVPKTHERGNATQVAWHPFRDKIAVGMDESSIYICNATTGQKKSLLRLIPGAPRPRPRRKGEVLSLAWNPKNKSQLAAGHDISFVCVWDADAEKLRHRFSHEVGITAHSKVCTVAWSSDGRLASGADDGTIRIWNLQTRAHLQIKPKGCVRSISWNPTGKALVSGSNGVVQVWDLAAGVPTNKSIDQPVNDVGWSKDGSLIAVGADSGKLYLLGAHTREWKQTFENKKSTPPQAAEKDKEKQQPFSISFSPGGSLSFSPAASTAAASSSAQETAFNVALNVVAQFTLKAASLFGYGHPAINLVAWNSRGELAAANEEGRVFIYDKPKPSSRLSRCKTLLSWLCCCCRRSRVKAD